MKLVAAIQADLAKVEDALSEAAGSAVPLVERVSRDFLAAGGKRLRPALVLLSFRACGGRGEAAIPYAAALELIHSATLFHDDVVDEAPLRRGVPTANARWGNEAAVLIGDYLYSQAIRILLDGARDRINRVLIRTTLAMTEGEMMQLRRRYAPDLTRSEYYEIAGRKTAGLMEACCRAGAVVAEAGDAVEEALGEFGRDLGLAFQLVDDLLDFTADPRTLGKEVMSDLREGAVTLPVIDLFERLPPAEAAALKEVVRDAAGAPADSLARLAERLKSEGCLARVRAEADGLARRACGRLAVLAPGEARDRLEELAWFTVSREG